MPVSASINFTQNAVSPGPGISMVGVGGLLVTLTNTNDTDVVQWTWELLDSPLNSALVPGIIGAAATESFTPDSGPETPGCYRVKLTVLGSDGSVACDVKNFAVATAQGWILPPFKATAAELNFPGNDEGWESLLNSIFLSIANGGSGTQIVYRPGAPSFGNAVGTWAEVMAIVAVSENATIYVDTSQQIPFPAPVPPGTYDMRFAEIASVALPSGIVVLDVQDGAVLQNVKAIRDGIELRCHPTTGPCLTFPATAGIPQVLAVWQGAVIDNQGTVPAIEVANGAFQVVAGIRSGFVGPQSGVCTTPIFNVAAGGTLALVDEFGVWSSNWASGDPGSTLVYNTLGPSFPDPPPLIPLFLGAVVFSPINNGNIAISPRIVYSPTVPGNWVGPAPTTVQEALDRIAAAIGPIA